jgi:ATP-dependent Lon protease
MTGELSANGEVCKIGAVKAKLIAAFAINIDTFLLPYANMSDALDCPPQLLDKITIYFIRDYDQIYKFLFEDKE